MPTVRPHALPAVTVADPLDKLIIDRAGATSRSILIDDALASRDPFATTTEATAGVITNRKMSPATTAAAINARLGSVEFDTIAALQAATVSASTNVVSVNGYYAFGDGGGGAYKRVADTGGLLAWQYRSNGATVRWELIPDQEIVNVRQLGAKGDGSTNDQAAFVSAFAFNKTVVMPAGTYNMASLLAMTDANTLLIQQGASFSGTQPTGGVRIYDLARAAAVTGSKVKIEKLWERADTYTLEDLGGAWPGPVGTFFGVSREFGAGYVTGAPSPASTTFAYASNTGSDADVVASMSVALCWVNNKTVFGANIIAGSQPGVTGVKMVGLEIDVQPNPGAAPSSASAGLYINSFNVAIPGPAIQLGTIGGGSFNNGLIINGVAGAGVAAASGAAMQSLINTSPGSYSQDAVILGNQQKTRYNSSGGSSVTVGCDTGNNLVIGGAGALITSRSSTTEGTPLVSIRDGSGVEAIHVYVARGAPPNAANSALKVAGQSVTSRSISAGGTINASGADYAEYEYRREDCRAFAKGDIVGFDANGLLTDRYDLALAFGVKSTNPNLVGGDTWAENIGPRPAEPVYVDPDIPRPPAPDFKGCDGLESNERQAEFDKAMAGYEAAQAAHRTAWEAREMVPYRAALAAFEAELEKARQKVERIAYCGKCPVNVIGAEPGDWIVPKRSFDGSIAAEIVADAEIDFARFKRSLGQVRRILPDGRAEIAVGVR